jgi:hypothetical protein
LLRNVTHDALLLDGHHAMPMHEGLVALMRPARVRGVVGAALQISSAMAGRRLSTHVSLTFPGVRFGALGCGWVLTGVAP